MVQRSSINFLIDYLNENNTLYQKGLCCISDTEFDSLSELVNYFTNSDNKINNFLNVHNKTFTVKRELPMLSLQNIYNKEAFFKFTNKFNNETFILEHKIDGVSCELVYEKGILKLAATRGNGYEGTDITAHVLKNCNNIPLTLSNKIDISIQGELFFPKNVFKQLKKEYEYKTSRNALAGLLNGKKSFPSGVFMQFAVHGFVLFSDNIFFNNYTHFLDVCTKKWLFLDCKFFESYKAELCFTELLKQQKSESIFDTDGVVIKINNLVNRTVAGATAHHPLWAVAYKFPSKFKATILKRIIFDTSKTGAVIPVAEVLPVKISGVTVQKVTLHNFKYIAEKNIGVNDIVFVERSGEVIPKIISNLKTPDSVAFIPPHLCPACGSSLKKDDFRLFCINDMCPAIIKNFIQFFCSKEAVNIKGLSAKTIEQLIENQFVKNVSDIYLLNVEKLLSLAGFSTTKANNLLNAIEQTRLNTPLEKIIYALSIKGIGKEASKELTKKFKTIDNLKNATQKDLSQLKNLGIKNVQNIIEYFENDTTVENLKKVGFCFNSYTK